MSITRHQAVSAYQRWKPPSFDEGGDDASLDHAAPSPFGDTLPEHNEPSRVAEEPAEPEPPAINLPTADELEQMYEQARAEGHAQGHAEGYEAGFAEGKRTAELEAQHLQQVVAHFDQSVSAINENIAHEIVALAIAVARQMIGKAVESDPEAVLHVVREALLQLPHNRSRLHVNPADAELIRQHLGDQLDQGHHQILEDEHIARGGCRIESTGCEIDATLPVRWQRVLESMGQDADEWGLEDWGL